MGSSTEVGVYKGYTMFFQNMSYNCPLLGLYGLSSESSLKIAITKKLKEKMDKK